MKLHPLFLWTLRTVPNIISHVSLSRYIVTVQKLQSSRQTMLVENPGGGEPGLSVPKKQRPCLKGQGFPCMAPASHWAEIGWWVLARADYEFWLITDQAGPQTCPSHRRIIGQVGCPLMVVHPKLPRGWLKDKGPAAHMLDKRFKGSWKDKI